MNRTNLDVNQKKSGTPQTTKLLKKIFLYTNMERPSTWVSKQKKKKYRKNYSMVLLRLKIHSSLDF